MTELINGWKKGGVDCYFINCLLTGQKHHMTAIWPSGNLTPE